MVVVKPRPAEGLGFPWACFVDGVLVGLGSERECMDFADECVRRPSWARKISRQPA